MLRRIAFEVVGTGTSHARNWAIIAACAICFAPYPGTSALIKTDKSEIERFIERFDSSALSHPTLSRCYRRPLCLYGADYPFLSLLVSRQVDQKGTRMLPNTIAALVCFTVLLLSTLPLAPNAPWQLDSTSTVVTLYPTPASSPSPSFPTIWH